MAIVTASRGAMHFPAQANPQTPNGDPISGGAAGAVIGSPGINPEPNALAGCNGALTINGVAVSGTGDAGAGILDLVDWGLKEIVVSVNANVPGVTASITPQGRLQLASLVGVPITIAGSANVLTALGLTAGSTNN